MILDIILKEDQETKLRFGPLVQFDYNSHEINIEIINSDGVKETVLPEILEIVYCKDDVSIATIEVPKSTALPHLSTVPFLQESGTYKIQFSYKDDTRDYMKTFAGTIKFTAQVYCEAVNGIPKPEYEDLRETKTDKGGYTGTSQDLKGEIDQINTDIGDLKFDDLTDTPATKQDKFIKGNTTSGNLEYTDIIESDITDLDKYTQIEVDDLLDGKVDKVAGKELSTNDYTDADKDIVGDALVKGTGYDDVKYPDAKAITDEVEQKMYALDSRNVFVFDSKDRNLENLQHGIYVKNPLTNGDGTIRGEDADSMAGVFNDSNGSFYCGEGYENLSATQDQKGTTWSPRDDATMVYTDLNNGWFRLQGVAPTLSPLFGQLLIDLENIESSSSLTIKNNGNENVFFRNRGQTSSEQISVGQSLRVTSTAQISPNSDRLYLATTTANASYDLEIKMDLTCVEGDKEFFFIKDTAPDGKLIIKEGWTSATHSFIITGKATDPTVTLKRFYLCSRTGSGTVETAIYDFPLNKLGLKYIAVVSNQYRRIFFEDGSSDSLGLNNAELSDGEAISFTRSIIDQRPEEIYNIFSYEGSLNETEFLVEKEKIKSNKFHLENTGVYEPVPGAKKRANASGKTKNFVMLENQSTNIELVETNKFVTTRADDGTERKDKIDSVGVITNISGGAGIEDVGGYIRLTVATNPGVNTKVKVVIENVE